MTGVQTCALPIFSSWAGGVLVWIALMAAAIAAIFLVWRETTTYS